MKLRLGLPSGVPFGRNTPPLVRNVLPERSWIPPYRSFLTHWASPSATAEIGYEVQGGRSLNAPVHYPGYSVSAHFNLGVMGRPLLWFVRRHTGTPAGMARLEKENSPKGPPWAQGPCIPNAHTFSHPCRRSPKSRKTLRFGRCP